MPSRLRGGALRLAGWLWAAPCTALGLAVAVVVVLLRGSARRFAGTLEVVLPQRRAARGPAASLNPWGAFTLGHVIIATSPRDLEQLRAHEREHVRQYERWGALLAVAFAVSSLWQVLRGRHPYWDNRFEVEARRRCGEERPGSGPPAWPGPAA